MSDCRTCGEPHLEQYGAEGRDAPYGGVVPQRSAGGWTYYQCRNGHHWGERTG